MSVYRYSGKGNAAIDFAKEMMESGTVEKIRAETDAASLLAPETEQKEKDYSRSLF